MRKLFVLLLAGLFLVACSDARMHQPGSHGTGAGSFGVGATIGAIGQIFTWAGGIGMGLCTLATVATFFVSFLSGLREIFLEGIAICFIATLFGASFIWLGNNPWLLAVCVGLVGLLLLVRYRESASIFWDYVINPTPSRARRKKTSQPLS